MARSRKEIDAEYVPLHAKLTDLYYAKKGCKKADFDRLHSAIWLLHERDSIAEGILPDYYVDEIRDEEGNIVVAGTLLRSQQILNMINALGGEAKLREDLNKVVMMVG